MKETAIKMICLVLGYMFAWSVVALVAVNAIADDDDVKYDKKNGVWIVEGDKLDKAEVDGLLGRFREEGCYECISDPWEKVYSEAMKDFDWKKAPSKTAKMEAWMRLQKAVRDFKMELCLMESKFVDREDADKEKMIELFDNARKETQAMLMKMAKELNPHYYMTIGLE